MLLLSSHSLPGRRPRSLPRGRGPRGLHRQRLLEHLHHNILLRCLHLQFPLLPLGGHMDFQIPSELEGRMMATLLHRMTTTTTTRLKWTAQKSQTILGLITAVVVAQVHFCGSSCERCHLSDVNPIFFCVISSQYNITRLSCPCVAPASLRATGRFHPNRFSSANASLMDFWAKIVRHYITCQKIFTLKCVKKRGRFV